MIKEYYNPAQARIDANNAQIKYIVSHIINGDKGHLLGTENEAKLRIAELVIKNCYIEDNYQDVLNGE